MGKINVLKVIIGGLVAGVVLSIVDAVLYGVLVKAPMAVEATADDRCVARGRDTVVHIPRLSHRHFSGVVVCHHAARLGAGPGSAAIAGLAGWFFAGLLCHLITLPMGIMPYNLTIITTAVMLIEYPLAVVIGAKLYTENGGREVAA